MSRWFVAGVAFAALALSGLAVSALSALFRAIGEIEEAMTTADDAVVLHYTATNGKDLNHE